MSKRRPGYHQKRRQRFVRRGGCVVCGKPRAMTTRLAAWGRRGEERARQSKKFCAYHLERNRVYARAHRERQGK